MFSPCSCMHSIPSLGWAFFYVLIQPESKIKKPQARLFYTTITFVQTESPTYLMTRLTFCKKITRFTEPRTHKVRFPALVLKRCCICKGKHAISPLAETKLNDPVEEVGQRTPKKQGDARTDSNTCDELALQKKEKA